MSEVLAPSHEHAFISGQNYCMFCGMSLREVREQMEHQMLIEAFNRLAKVLEKLEAKLDA